ncbi:PGPGW domain-containing protein [Aliiglaciecola sp. LCG003]|uniref:PGPGW domain-containing protein n=1 Tax=Aliiglaciecola sp. LCG003 TaxID=3053655 RepID=UPI00257403C4|nr:PGPGW domain-containing protein [Aliiglaciecola sp. LCG003]WJG10888.1 PGPGW domain-containing protein [Aliiglaciecola sp. LCG003]
MIKYMRITLGAILTAAGVVFAILPGSSLFLLSGLVVLSYDLPVARNWLRKCQSMMASGARKLDRLMLNRRLR